MMVADQWKKRLRAASTVDYYSQEPHRLKKKKQGLERCGLKLRSNIALAWDDRKRCVLAKKEQIGISWRELTPLLDYLPHNRSILADVYTLPNEIFEFENLSEVLSHKVWQENLSEDERGFLVQFLPEGSDPDEIVCKLLDEENFHFGNPFLKWGQMICSGGFHPDNVMRREQLFKANKKAYYMELQNYHDNMIGNLQLWKENLESCKDSEEEIVERILRKGFMEGTYGSSPDGAKVIARSRKGEKLNKRNIQHSDGAKYMSYIKVTREHYQRVKNSMKHNSNSIQPRYLTNVLGDVENLHVQPFEYYEEEERQKLHDHWLHLANRDVPAGLANWIKRRSHVLQVRRSLGQEMEQRLKVQTKGEEKKISDGIFTELNDNKEVEEKRSSDAILAEQTDNKEADGRSSGGIFAELTDNKEAEDKRSSDVIFAEVTDNKEAEESSTEVIFAEVPDNKEAEERSTGGTFAEVTNNKEAEERSTEVIFAEVPDNKEAEERSTDATFAEVTNNKEAEERSTDGILAEVTDNKEAEAAISMEVEVDERDNKEKSDGFIEKQMEREIVNDELPLQLEDQEGGDSAGLCDKQIPDSIGEPASLCDKQSPDSTVNLDSDDESLPVLPNQHLHHVSLDESNQLSHFKPASPTVPEYENRMIHQTNEAPQTVSGYPESLNNVDVPVDQGDLLVSTGDDWAGVSVAASYGCATPISHEYSSAEQLSLGHPRVTDEPAASLINLESIPTEKDAGRDMLPTEPSEASLFGSYPLPNRNEIFQPFLKGPDSLSYSHDQTQPPLEFQPSTNLMVEPSQYSGHFREQLHPQLPLELRPKGLNDLFMHPNFQGNLYSFPRHEQLNIGMQEWAVNSAHMSAPSQSHLSSGDLLSQNWFSGENQARGGWSTLEGVGGPSQSTGSINNSDQSLYSVFSECNELHQSGSYGLSGSREGFIPSRNYSDMGVGVPTTSNVLQQPTKPLSYMSSQESPGGLKPNGLGWASMSSQNPGLQDSLGKPFLRSWNP